jgi:hypothetical protein
MESDLWDTLNCMFFTSLVEIDFISFRYTACVWSLEILWSWSKAWYYVAVATVGRSGGPDIAVQIVCVCVLCIVISSRNNKRSPSGWREDWRHLIQNMLGVVLEVCSVPGRLALSHHKMQRCRNRHNSLFLMLDSPQKSPRLAHLMF